MPDANPLSPDLLRYLAIRDQQRADQVTARLARFEGREQLLVREAAVMGYVLGHMAGEVHGRQGGKPMTGRIPPDSAIVAQVLLACENQPDLYPLIGEHVEDKAVALAEGRPAEPTPESDTGTDTRTAAGEASPQVGPGSGADTEADTRRAALSDNGLGWNRVWLLDCMIPHLPSASYNEPDLHDEAQRQVVALLADRDRQEKRANSAESVCQQQVDGYQRMEAELVEVTAERNAARRNLSRILTDDTNEGDRIRERAELTAMRQALGDIASLAATAKPIDDPTGTLDRLGEIVRLAQAACRPHPRQPGAGRRRRAHHRNHRGGAMSAGHCHYCGPTGEELRPYGPGGATVCFRCATATPEREAATGAAYGTLLEAAAAMSPDGLLYIGEQSGPQPVTAEEVLDEIPTTPGSPEPASEGGAS